MFQAALMIRIQGYTTYSQIRIRQEIKIMDLDTLPQAQININIQNNNMFYYLCCLIIRIFIYYDPDSVGSPYGYTSMVMVLSPWSGRVT